MNKIYKLPIALSFAVLLIMSFARTSNAQTVNFQTNLYYGITNNTNVEALQEFLTSQGDYSGPISGNFFSLTLTAVKKFQTINSITPVSGYFGTLTRTVANTVLLVGSQDALTGFKNSASNSAEITANVQAIKGNSANAVTRAFENATTTTPTTPTTFVTPSGVTVGQNGVITNAGSASASDETVAENYYHINQTCVGLQGNQYSDCITYSINLPPTQSVSQNQSSKSVTTAPPSPITISGTGQTASRQFTLQQGLAVFTMTYSGSGNFIVELLDSNGNQIQNLANKIGSYNGSQAIQIPSTGSYLFNVQGNSAYSSGTWSITITQPTPSSNQFFTPQQTLTGNGDTASQFFNLSEGLHTFNLSYTGGGNFIVELLDQYGNPIEDLENVIGTFNGSTAVRINTPAAYMLNVEASSATSGGSWTVGIE